MARDWEGTFAFWAQGPSKTEQERYENAERQVRQAIRESPRLAARNITVFTQGSYRNRVNVRQESDVDIGVCCYDVYFGQYPEGMTRESLGHTGSDYTFLVFKNEVEEALVNRFGRAAVTRGNKAFDIKANTYRVEADVAPFFEHRRYSANRNYLSGVELRADNGGTVINWPEQHYTNGVSKNTASSRRYKGMVRILKNLRNEMDDAGQTSAKPIPGFLVECLVWNAPNECFGKDTFKAAVRATLAHLFNNTMSDEKCSDWGEVSELKYLFRGGQPWTREQAHAWLGAAWNYVGFE